MRFLSLRAAFLFGFVIAMPVLALPPVARRIDELLYGKPPKEIGQPLGSGKAAAARKSADSTPLAAAADRASPALLDALATGGTTAAPLLSPTPPFDPPRERVTPAAAEVPTRVTEHTIARLQQIRQRLEDLGAEYVVVETTGDGGRYRFFCRMLVDQRSRFTRPFESSAFDPLAAGEQVLKDVETWRSAGRAAAPPIDR